MRLSSLKVYIYVVLYANIIHVSFGEVNWDEITLHYQQNSSNILNCICKIRSVSKIDNKYIEKEIQEIKKEHPGVHSILLTKNSESTLRYQNETYIYEKDGRRRHDLECGTLDEKGNVIENSRDISKIIRDDKKSVSYQESLRGTFATISKKGSNSTNIENPISSVFGIDFFERVERWTKNNVKNDAATVTFKIKENGNEIVATLENNGQRYQVFFDRDKGYSLIRQNRYTHSTLMASKKYHYQQINSIWLPSELTIIKYSNGVPVISKKTTYSDIEINKGIDDSLFEFELPAGTLVDDLIANIRYEVGNPESTQTINSEQKRLEKQGGPCPR